MTTEALSTEVPDVATQLARARHEFAQASGLDVMPDPLPLDQGQEKALLEEFPNTDDLVHENLKILDQSTAGLGPLQKELDISRGKLADVMRGDDVVVLVPPSAPNFNGSRDPYQSPVAKVRRGMGVKLAASAAGISEDRLTASYLPRASVEVYNSPQNGSPIITERVIQLPDENNGGVSTIHEMVLHGAGSGEPIDSQVVVVHTKA